MRKSLIAILIILILAGVGYFAYSKGLIDLGFLKKGDESRIRDLKIDINNKEEQLQDYSVYDFSQIIIPQRSYGGFLGYIGQDYRRLKITFFSVEKDSKNNLVYNVIGRSEVGTSINDFEGTITINEIQVLFESQMHFGVDDEYKNQGIKAQGTVIGTYELKEDKNQKNSGIFNGKMTLDWYLDKNNQIKYDSIQVYSDGYKNNQYEGTWKGYNSITSKVANWGEYQIPNSGDLNESVSDFSVNPKYLKNGWESFQDEVDIFKHLDSELGNNFSVDLVKGNFAKGGVGFMDSGYSAHYIAIKQGGVGGIWTILFSGQDDPSCKMMKDNNVPIEIYGTCY